MPIPQRIAYVLTQDRGGPVDVCLPLAVATAANGADVAVFGPPPARPWPGAADLFVESAVDDKADIAAAAALRRRLRAWRPDIVHAHDRRSGLVTAAMSWGRHRPRTVQTYHGVPDDVTQRWFTDGQAGPGPSSYTRTVLAADAVVARTLDATLAPSPTMTRFLVDRLRFPARRTSHVDNGLPLPDAAPPAGTIASLLFVGLLVERKGLADLLPALAQVLRERGGDDVAAVTLDVAGDGPERDGLERLTRDLGITGNVRFLGFRRDIPELMRACDAVVLPSRMEQQPLVLIEAMGAGKPVLATDCGGVADMVAGSGVDVPLAIPGDLASLTAGLRGLLRTAAPAAVGKALSEHARRRFALHVSVDAHLAVYRGLLDS